MPNGRQQDGMQYKKQKQDFSRLVDLGVTLLYFDIIGVTLLYFDTIGAF